MPRDFLQYEVMPQNVETNTEILNLGPRFFDKTCFDLYLVILLSYFLAIMF